VWFKKHTAKAKAAMNAQNEIKKWCYFKTQAEEWLPLPFFFFFF